MARASSLALAAATTDGAFVAARAGQKVRITSLWVQPGSATTVTLNSKSGGAGTAISPPITTFVLLQDVPSGWLESLAGEGVSITTSAGAASAIVANYTYVTP